MSPVTQMVPDATMVIAPENPPLTKTSPAVHEYVSEADPVW